MRTIGNCCGLSAWKIKNKKKIYKLPNIIIGGYIKSESIVDHNQLNGQNSLFNLYFVKWEKGS
jgi:hypothetical protein